MCFASAELAKRRTGVLTVIVGIVFLIIVLSIVVSEKQRKAEAPDRPWPTYPLPPK